MSIKVFAALLVFVGMSLGAVPSPAQSVIANIPVSGTPFGVAADPINNRIYAAISPSSVAVIDGATNSLLETVPLPFGAQRVAINVETQRVYIAGCVFSTPLICGMSVLDAKNNNVIGSTIISSQEGIGLQGLAVNDRTNRIYVSDANNELVDVIDGESNTVIANISLGGSQPLGLAVDPQAHRLFAVINGPEVAVINTHTDALVTRITVGRENANAAVNPFTRGCYVTDEIFAPSNLGVVNTRHLHVITNIAVGNTPFDVAVDVRSNRVFVTNIGDSTISVIDGESDRNIATVPVFGRFIAVDPVTHRVYASDDQLGVIHVISEH